MPCKSTCHARHAAYLFIKHVFVYFGMPYSFVSDRDARFTSEFWRTLFELIDTKLHFSSAFHPETDGQTERMNRTLVQMLRATVNKNKKQ